MRNAVQAEVFISYQEDADLYPYWVWRGVMDDRERESHVEMEGQVFRIGDPEGDACFPPGEDNCRCEGENCDDDYLAENGLKVNSNDEAKQLLNTHINERFRFNPAIQGTQPNTGSYFDVLGSANEASAKTFDLPDAEDEAPDTEMAIYAAKGLHAMIVTMDEWRKEYHEAKNGDIVFQNKATKTNVRFNNHSLHAIQKHNRGFELIPQAIMQPDEIWMHWENPEKQLVVLRNYIIFGKTSYIVQTRDGLITDAFAVSNKACDKFRRGVFI